MITLVNQGKHIKKIVNNACDVVITRISYQGPAMTLYAWVGLLQGEWVVYEPNTAILGFGQTAAFKVPLCVQKTCVDIHVPIHLLPVPVLPEHISLQEGFADAMMLILKAPSLDRSAWLLRAFWLEEYEFMSSDYDVAS